MDWQTIETAPKDGTVVLLWAGGHYPVVGWFWVVSGLWCDVWSHEWDYPKEPTHWQPLPEPPHGN